MQDTSGHKQKVESNFLVVGLVRNCEKKIKEDVLRLLEAIGQAKQLHWLLIESDSTDLTLNKLKELSTEIPNFRHISLGTLKITLPLRTQRIAHCRNEYVKEIRKIDAYKAVDYVIVSDFDGLNTHITSQAIDSCWKRVDWDMCAANQRGPYYDIWALRHKNWSPNDCWAQYKFLNIYEPNTEKNIYSSVYSRMITLPTDRAWIEVDSAFGGLAIYKKELFDIAEYIGLDENGEEFCEHVPFHNKLKQNGAKLFINPQLINAEYTEHTRHLLFTKRITRKFKSIIKRTLRAILGYDKALKLEKSFAARRNN